MFTHLPDPYPGRCLNHRTVTVNGYPQQVRCLDYENVPHECSFPEVRRVDTGHGWGNTQTAGVPIPGTTVGEAGARLRRRERMNMERDWDVEWCKLRCETCGLDIRDGVAIHLMIYGHTPVVSNRPVLYGSDSPYNWAVEGECSPNRRIGGQMFGFTNNALVRCIRIVVSRLGRKNGALRQQAYHNGDSPS